VAPPGMDAREAGEQARYAARQGFVHVTAGEVQVVDDEGAEVPADGATMGEVVATGNTLMMGYYRQPEATEEAFRGGRLHTGDVGVRQPDGSIELRDRKKDVVISGGENIPTIEVEQAIMSHPAVLEAAVVAVPDERWGEAPKAFVALKPGCSLTAEEVVAHVRDRIAHFKAPRHVEFGELPKTSTGKIQKFLLREGEWAGRDRRIS
jgi:fatty-acyl-CoA synthase